MVAANSWEEMFNNAALREQYKNALYFLQTLSIELENREITKRIFPDPLPYNNVRIVTEFPTSSTRICVVISRQIKNPTIVLLPPGIYNLAHMSFYGWLGKDAH